MITNLKIGYGGRIGNQMFQYAMLMAVANKLNTEVKIPKNNSTITKEDGCLDLFTNKWIPYRFNLTECFMMPNLKWMTEQEKQSINNFVTEKQFQFDPELFNVPDNTSFDGYFQSFRYFENIMPAIQSEFTFKPEIIEKAFRFHEEARKDGNEIVAIHVRRGDYLGIPDRLPVCEPEYYEEALSHFTDKSYKFLVCSDDIEWCIATFGNDESVFYPIVNDVYTDLCAMSFCDHLIISNSTFSLWAALLCNNANKKVIAPNRWFGPALINNTTNDLVPESWIRI
jgi:hypothetical protein